MIIFRVLSLSVSEWCHHQISYLAYHPYIPVFTWHHIISHMDGKQQWIFFFFYISFSLTFIASLNQQVRKEVDTIKLVLIGAKFGSWCVSSRSFPQQHFRSSEKNFSILMFIITFAWTFPDWSDILDEEGFDDSDMQLMYGCASY